MKSTTYVDDTTVYHVSSDLTESILQQAGDRAIALSDKNSINVNAAKTKEMLISFTQEKANAPSIIIKGGPLERVSETKLLGVLLNGHMTWYTHVDYIHKKAISRLHFIPQLKQSKLPL